MSTYIVHAIEGRARLRHTALGDPKTLAQAQAMLEQEDNVLAVQPGKGSLLLLLSEKADLTRICERLEARFPEFSQKTASSEVHSTCAGDFSAMLRKFVPGCTDMPPRKLELRAMLGLGATSLALGFLGNKEGHVLTGALFTLLAARHAWKRRKAL